MLYASAYTENQPDYCFNYSCFQQYLKEKKIDYYISLDIYYFCCSSFIPEIPVFPVYHFLLVQRASFSISVKSSLLATNSLLFLYLETSLFYSHFLKNIFTGYTVLSFITLKMLFRYLLFSMISDAIVTVIQTACVVLSFFLFRPNHPSWYCNFMSFIKFWKYSDNISSSLPFPCMCHFPIFWYFSNMGGRPFDVVSQEAETLFIFLNLSLCVIQIWSFLLIGP